MERVNKAMSKAIKLLNTIKKNNLTEGSLIKESGNKTDIDLVLNVIEKFDLGYDCMKSSYKGDMDSVTEMLESMSSDDINENLVENFLINNIILGEAMTEENKKTVLVQPKPYHNIFSKSVGNSYSPIMRGRLKGGSADVSTLELGSDKFYQKDNGHYEKLFNDAVSSAQPRKRYRQLVRALVNLVVNFKDRRPDLSDKARSFLNLVTGLPKPDDFFKSKK